ncbi:hypothetical protein VTJ83DRAFT_3095 [Remersonia thermophila]|uniref:Glycosyltransferase family 31 protein n=1 Tax=Remersonia thermophila TaxID=72144 RepID=A0ABR4DDZ0_9PEZI
MLAHQFSARGYLSILAALLLTIFLLTAHRLNRLPPALSPYLDDALFASAEPAASKQPIRPQHGTTEVTVAHPADASSSQPDPARPSPQGTADLCSKDWELLRRKDLGLTNNIVYTRRCIRPAFGDVDRNAVANISSPLVGATTTISLRSSDCAALVRLPCEPLPLRVPRPYPDRRGRYGHLMFGVASTYERIWASLPEFAHWLSGTSAHLVLVVQDVNEVPGGADLAALTAAFRSRGISATVKPPSIQTAIRRADEADGARLASPAPVEQIHFLLINDMLEMATRETQWLGVLDDDTFFPALHPLSQMLAAYDHRLPHWLGALSDRWTAVKSWGYMAFGGAGTFLSKPLALELSPHLESCLRETNIRTGDGMLKECMALHSSTRLTLVDGLHQHDLRGDVSGFFESGRKVLSMHHWKSWYRAPVLAMAAVTSLCGDCFLQRWRFGRDTLLVNGYSISVYRDGLDGIDLSLMEGTFDGAGPAEHGFMYGAFRPRLGDREKKSYRLAVTDGPRGKGDGFFRQVYVHRAARGENGAEGAMDEVVELIWEV